MSEHDRNSFAELAKIAAGDDAVRAQRIERFQFYVNGATPPNQRINNSQATPKPGEGSAKPQGGAADGDGT